MAFPSQYDKNGVRPRRYAGASDEITVSISPKVALVLAQLMDGDEALKTAVREVDVSGLTEQDFQDRLAALKDLLDNGAGAGQPFEDQLAEASGLPSQREKTSAAFHRGLQAIRYRRETGETLRPSNPLSVSEAEMKVALKIAERRKCSFDEALELLRS